MDSAWNAALVPLSVLAVASVPGLVIAWAIPRVPAQGGPGFSAKLAVSHFANLADLWRDLPLRRASFGVAFFWGFAAFINLWSVKIAKGLTGGGEGFGTMSSVFMAAASLGMAAGFGFASFLLRKRIELGWVPAAGIAMTLSAVTLAFIPPGGWPFLVDARFNRFLRSRIPRSADRLDAGPLPGGETRRTAIRRQSSGLRRGDHRRAR